MEKLGNTALLDKHRIGYLSGSKIETLSVLPTLDWALEISSREDIAVVSGFHSCLERQTLDTLLSGKCGIICVLGRGMYKKIPRLWQSAYDEGRLLFISLEKENITRTSRQTSRRRNEYIASIADELIVASLTPESSLNEIIEKASCPIKKL